MLKLRRGTSDGGILRCVGHIRPCPKHVNQLRDYHLVLARLDSSLSPVGLLSLPRQQSQGNLIKLRAHPCMV